MKTYLGFSVLEYSIVFGAAIIFGALLNLYLTRLSDRKNKATMLYFAAGVFAAGMQTTSVLVYIILCAFTALGVLSRAIAPVMLNITGRLLAKIRKQPYNVQTYEMLLQNLPGMRSGIWLFTSIKMFLWILLTMSLFKMI
jgi:hypothetical protein